MKICAFTCNTSKVTGSTFDYSTHAIECLYMCMCMYMYIKTGTQSSKSLIIFHNMGEIMYPRMHILYTVMYRLYEVPGLGNYVIINATARKCI